MLVLSVFGLLRSRGRQQNVSSGLGSAQDNLAGSSDLGQIMGLLEQLLSSNNGKLDLPDNILPTNVTQEIENHYQGSGSLSQLPTQNLQQHRRSLEDFLSQQMPPKR
jgi:hypothetical protein